MGLRVMSLKLVFTAFSVFSILCTGLALGSDDQSDTLRDIDHTLSRYQSDELDLGAISASEVFHRTQAVLDHFNVPVESETQSEMEPFQGIQTMDRAQALLPYFDPHGGSSRFLKWESSSLRAFQDLNAFDVSDFEVRLAQQQVPDNTLAEHLKQARESALPLQGLKILLDPGHMGGAGWDDITGKWVEDSTGHRMSEGVINLQTAMVLEQKLQSLGAEVMITRRGLRPVSNAPYDSFDVHAAALTVLREAQLLSWFTKLLTTAPVGPALYSAFSSNSNFNQIFAEGNKGTYYNTMDLQARVDAIDAFQPDITLVLHYDAATHAVSTDAPFTHDATKVYVPGSFDPTEMASRDDRSDFAKHLLDETPWRASVALAHQVVTTLSRNLKIPVAHDSSGIVKQIEPGLFARNLYLLKKHHRCATAYVESLFYNDGGEFAAFSNATHPLMIDGENYPYSDRLDLVAESLKDAVVQYVQSGF